MPKVSLTMIVRNESANLPDCLRSVAGLFDETVIVDTGSTDDTKEIAASFGARVFEFPWCDDFSAARNESLRHATGDWFFWMDADDRLDYLNRPKLKALLTTLSEPCFHRIAVVSLYPGGHFSPMLRPNLFHRSLNMRWTRRIHETLRPLNKELSRPTEICVTHTGYLAPRTPEKVAFHVRLLKLELADHPNDPGTHYYLGREAQDSGDDEQASYFFNRCLTLMAGDRPDYYRTLVERMTRLP